MSNLDSRSAGPLEERRARHRRAARGMARAAAREAGRGLVQLARLEARAKVARQAMANLAYLSKDEEGFIQMAPLGEPRYKAVGDTFAMWAAREIGQ